MYYTYYGKIKISLGKTFFILMDTTHFHISQKCKNIFYAEYLKKHEKNL